MKKQIPSIRDYPFSNIPAPVDASTELSQLDKRVFGILHSFASFENPPPLSSQKIADRLGADSSRVRKVISRLIKFGLLVRTSDAKSARGTWRAGVYNTALPEWLFEEAERKGIRLIGSLTGREGENNESFPVGSSGPEGSGPGDPRVGSGEPEGSGPEDPTIRKKIKRDIQEGGRSAPDDSGAVDEEEEPVENDGRAGRERLAREKAERARRREGRTAAPKGKTRRTRGPSGADFVGRASERWELNRWREKPEKRWGGMDLLGYWACMFRERKGREDGAQRFPDCGSGTARKHARNLARFVEVFLGGSVAEYRRAVLKVLEREEDPVFNMLWTPSTDRVLREVLDGKRRRAGRELTPIEKDDLQGRDREGWKGKAARNNAARRSREQQAG